MHDGGHLRDEEGLVEGVDGIRVVLWIKRDSQDVTDEGTGLEDVDLLLPNGSCFSPFEYASCASNVVFRLASGILASSASAAADSYSRIKPFDL